MIKEPNVDKWVGKKKPKKIQMNFKQKSIKIAEEYQKIINERRRGSTKTKMLTKSNDKTGFLGQSFG
jgi:hypothetical protein